SVLGNAIGGWESRLPVGVGGNEDMRLRPVEISVDFRVYGKVLEKFDVRVHTSLRVGPDEVVRNKRSQRNRVSVPLCDAIDDGRSRECAVRVVYRAVGPLQQRQVNKTILVSQRDVRQIPVTREAGADLEPVLCLGIYGGVQRIAVEVGRDHRTLLFEIAAGNVVIGFVVGAGEGNGVVVFGGAAENGVLPVCSGAEFGWIGEFDPLAIAEQAGKVVLECSILRQLHHRQEPGLVLPAVVKIITQVSLPGLAFFGRNDDDAIGAPAAIDGRCRGVFEYVYGFDVVRVQTGEHAEGGFLWARRHVDRRAVAVGLLRGITVDGYAVNHVQGFRTCKGGDTPYMDADPGAGLTRVLGDGHAGEPALEHLVDVGLGNVGNILCRERGDRPIDVA